MNINDFKPVTNLGIPRKDNPFWYKNFRDGYLAEVTDEASNANLDIGKITLEKPTAIEASQGLVFYAEVLSNLGSFAVAIFQSHNKECLELRAPQYVLVSPLVAAQVLRYCETQCVLNDKPKAKMSDPDWYRYNFPELEGVDNRPCNKEIGLDNILIFDPTESQVASRVVCTVVLKMINADIRCQVRQLRDHGILYVIPPQTKEVRGDEVLYHDEVKLHAKLQAQLLRYIETQIDIVEEVLA